MYISFEIPQTGIMAQLWTHFALCSQKCSLSQSCDFLWLVLKSISLKCVQFFAFSPKLNSMLASLPIIMNFSNYYEFFQELQKYELLF